MRSRTPQRAAQERLYRARRKEWLEGRPCAGYGLVEGCQGTADTIQHLKGRRGALLLDERFWLGLCWEPCHRTATENPAWAILHGLALPRVAS